MKKELNGFTWNYWYEERDGAFVVYLETIKGTEEDFQTTKMERIDAFHTKCEMADSLGFMPTEGLPIVLRPGTRLYELQKRSRENREKELTQETDYRSDKPAWSQEEQLMEQLTWCETRHDNAPDYKEIQHLEEEGLISLQDIHTYGQPDRISITLTGLGSYELKRLRKKYSA